MITVNISDEQPPHYIRFYIIIICCTWNICPRAVEQASQATTRENLSSGYPTNQSLWLNRLDRKLKLFRTRQVQGWFFSKSRQQSCWWDCVDAQAGLGLYCYNSPGWFSQSRSNCYMCHLTMAHIRKQDAKFDYRAIWEFRQNCNLCSLFKAFSVNI